MGLRPFLRAVARVTTAATIPAAAYVALDEGRRDNARGTWEGVVRFSRASYNGAIAMYGYAAISDIEKQYGKRSPEYMEARKPVDTAAAQRLLQVARAHGGMYIKLTQYLSTLNHVLPREWTEVLSEVQDRAPSRPWADVARVFREDTGLDAKDVFASIEEAPIAAASLAQVHVAHLKGTGEKVAVKLQYPGLGRQVASDMLALRFFLGVMGAVFPEHQYSWLWPEFAASAENELDFLKEAATGERVAAMFAGQRHVHVPRVHRSLSTQRVLVMEFIDGVRATDLKGLARLGVRPLDVANTACRFFGDQIHVHGLVHCDPHPGNLMVRRDPGTRDWQLVVIDHGLYRALSPSFRAAYCRLWKALITRDMPLGTRAAVELGLEPGSFETLSLLLTFRSTKSSATLGGRMSAGDIERLKKDVSHVDAEDVNRFLQRLPRDLLFVLRASNMVRALNKDLGGTSRARFRIMGESAIRGLVLTDAVDDFSERARRYAAEQAAVNPSQFARVRPKKAKAAAVGKSEQDAAQAGANAADSGSAGPSTGASPSSTTPSAPTSTSTTLSKLSSLARLGWEVLTNLGSEPPREPLTYLNALSTHALPQELTDSERLALAQAATAHRGGWLRAAAGAVTHPRDAWKRAQAQAGIVGLWARLLQLDAAFWLISLLGQWTYYNDPAHPHREAG